MKLLRLLKHFDKVVTFALMGIMALVVLAATVEVIIGIIGQLVAPPIGVLDTVSLQNIFGAVLLVLIGVELFESLKAYALEHVFRAEIVITVAMVAIARKVIILDVSHTDASLLFGIAAIVGALGIAYHLFTRNQPRDEDLALLRWWNKGDKEGEGPPRDLWDRMCDRSPDGEALDGSAGRSGPREER